MNEMSCQIKFVLYLNGVFSSKIHVCLLISSRGHADAEIEAVFAKYDVDGDRVLDEEECKKMQEDLEGQKVS